MSKTKSTTIRSEKADVTPEERYRMIAEAAYFRAEKRGFTGGDVVNDWIQAEAEIDHLLQPSGKAMAAMPPRDIEQRVQAVFASEVAAISERVRAITLQALSTGALDGAALKEVMTAVVKGARQGAAQRGESGAQALTEAMHGLDAALAAAAEATQLAIHEAAGRTNEFSRQGLKRTADELAAVEALFIETLGNTARNATDFTKKTLNDLAEHARASGTAVGTRVQSALAQLTRTLADTAQAKAKAGSQALRNEGALLAGLAAGLLKGIAERLQAAPATTKKPAKTKKGN